MREANVFTVGYSNHTPEQFVALLRKAAVTAVADVRSVPYSRFQPQFNRTSLPQILKPHGIAYVFLGDELGARSTDPDCYDQGRVPYARLAKSEPFKTGIERVIRGTASHSVALMCAEKEPLSCHRTLLVSRTLETRGLAVQHIHADGRLESHDAAMTRLLDLLGLSHADLFRSHDTLLAEAYAQQEARNARAPKPGIEASSDGVSPSPQPIANSSRARR